MKDQRALKDLTIHDVQPRSDEYSTTVVKSVVPTVVRTVVEQPRPAPKTLSSVEKARTGQGEVRGGEANMQHTRESWPDSGLGFQVKFVNTLRVGWLKRVLPVGVAHDQKMSKGHQPGVVYHRVYNVN